MPALSLPTTLLVFAAQCLVFSGAGVAAQVWRRRLTGRGSTALGAVLLAALAPCVLGYLAFALYFAHPLAGRIFSWGAMAAILGTLAHTYLFPAARALRPAIHLRLIALTALAGVFYISVLFVFTGPKFTDTASSRFLANMPGDSEIPRIFAEHLYTGTSPKGPGGDWLSSDRPPLQSGLALVTLPALRALDFGYDKACATAGVWFQLLWIPALWVFLRWLGLTEHQAHAATAALVFTGFLLFNSVFVWPKLAGAALVLLAFCTFFATESAIEPRHRWLVGGTLAAFGSLAHGGVMFSLFALAPLAVFSFRRRWRSWLLAATAFVVLSLPWFAYQRFYEPPGNRLVKWHLAGAIAPDSRDVVEALVENYRRLGWAKVLETRRDNLATIFHGSWQHLLTTRDRDAIAGRRSEEIFYTFRTPAAWLLGLVSLPALVFLHVRRRPAWRDHVRRHGLALAWLGLTLAFWLALMFLPSGTLVHQGSYVVPLLLLGLLAAWTLFVSRWLFAALALLQLGLFTLTWMPPTAAFTAAPAPLAIAVAGLSALLIATLGVSALFPAAPARSDLRASVPLWLSFRSLRLSQLTPALFVAFAILLFLRKPYALLVPQPYAEDGSIFLAQNDLVGLRALFEQYMGYLHTLPRLIAWTASQLLDPAWWPAFYNVAAFALWLAVVVRTFSPRLPLPPALRPWLALTFFLGPQTGEVLFSVTNLQWILAFLLIEQAFVAPPTTVAQRVGDLVLLVLLGLTGPFIIALGPLLAWRWWRARTADNLALLLVATACAAIQAWFVVQTGPHFTFPPFVASRFFEVVGQHLLVWPVLGDHLARHLPPAVVGFAGIVPVVAVLAWSLRPHPRRLLRAQLVAAFALMMVAGVYRSRPDTWSLDNLVFGDRYFYLPRVLLAWLLILEIDTAQRAVAWTARALLLACALVHVKGYSVPAEPDYRWTEHVDPIRRGVPANIPTLPEGWTMEYRGRPAPR
ncbi:MAG: hypothetical protein NTV51_07780 [Verrucomicrobia bacterium]|nr:hypothetical protein [Verrucomicrobiota bacterium]